MVVELSPVKFWRVEEPVTERLARVERPESTESVLPKVTAPVRAEVPPTERALETFKLVVVALLVVAFKAVKFWSVVEPVTNRLERVVRPVKLDVPPATNAFETYRVVVVALVVVELTPVKFWRVDEAKLTKPLLNVADPLVDSAFET